MLETEISSNLRYRREVIALGDSSQEARNDIWMRCERDPMWFTSTFLYTFDPQNYPDAPERPLAPWPHQARAMRKVAAAIGKHNLLFPKSRRMGVTTLVLAMFFHRWRFLPKQSFLLLSAKEDRVDKRGDPSSLMYKLDHYNDLLPKWLRAPVDRALLRFANGENGSIVNGESTNSDADRGGVRTAVLGDEVGAMPNANEVIAAVAPLTNSLFLVSTPKGAYGAFHSLYQKWMQEAQEWVTILHWTMHPRFSQGLYFTDEPYTGWADPSWGGRHPRSPWYDNECRRAPGPKWIAQELDINFNEAGGRFFEESLVSKLLTQVRRPSRTGELLHDTEQLRWTESPQGRLLLWCPISEQGNPPRGEYVVGADVALGVGGTHSSHSAISVVEKSLGLKVAEFKSNRVNPHDLARLAVAVCRWFYGAKLIWGCQGPGVTFGNDVTEKQGYWNVHFREDETAADHNQTKKLGYSEQGESRMALFGDYLDALATGRFRNPSEEAVKELRQFILAPDGSVQHSAAIQREQEPEHKGKLHGDLVIADAMANRLLPVVQENIARPVSPLAFSGPFPKNSTGSRFQEILRREAEDAYD